MKLPEDTNVRGNTSGAVEVINWRNQSIFVANEFAIVYELEELRMLTP